MKYNQLQLINTVNNKEIKMIIIKSLFFQITIPSDEEYAIFSNDYYIDCEGNVFDKPALDKLDVYEYGDIIIQTARVIYIIKRIYSAYDYVANIIHYIDEHINDSIIKIDMSELNENWYDHHDETISNLV